MSSTSNSHDNKSGISPSDQVWKDKLQGKMPEDWSVDIEKFETEIFLKKQGKVEDKVFAETRLRQGVYGQRYDNGTRHNGSENREIPFPEIDLTKGPNTKWHAPGMQRIKIPYGGMTNEQLEVLADLAEEYSDSILHVTTRQDIQLHFVHVEDTPSMFRRLAAVGITVKEACGNSVRNITGCPVAGVCGDEAFDTTPYADALFRYLLGHPDVQDFGRKFKIAFSGCEDKPCALVGIHDLGFIAKTKEENGQTIRGFKMLVGGGLGAIPQKAQVLGEFVTEDEIFPLTQAICRVYARYGEKKNRNRARIKFLIKDWGMEKFTEEVFKERKILTEDDRWVDFIDKVPQYKENPLKAGEKTVEFPDDQDFKNWLKHNVEDQSQVGYSAVTIELPLGDMTSNQARKLVDLAQKYVGDTIRTTVEQNLILRWVSQADLYSLYQGLKSAGLSSNHAHTIVDITSCPGTDTCKLGVSASRGLAGELRARLAEKSYELDESIRNFRIKVSGCFNSCSQHHVADLGFYGVSRKSGNYLVPHFQLVIGGSREENGAHYGLAIAAFPSKSIPDVVEKVADFYLKEKQEGEALKDFVVRVGKVTVKKELQGLVAIPSYDEKPEFYKDWGDVREFTTSDIGIGECAGEVVSLIDFGLTQADREVFEAQISLDENKLEEAAQKAFKSMVSAAQALIKGTNPDISDNPDEVMKEFQLKFLDTEVFFDPFAKDKFAKYFLKAHGEGLSNINTQEKVRQFIEESQLFIEAAYSCHVRMSMQTAS